jgi:hypothetical protein
MSQFQAISGKKLKVFLEARVFKHRYFFLEIEDSIFKALYKI